MPAMIDHASPSRSGFSNVDQTPDPAAYVRRLDRTGALAFWQSVKRRMAALLDVRDGDRVLDVGCGTGDDVRALARMVGATGCAIGVDPSATMIAEARRRTDAVALPVAFYQGDACHLEFPDATFDACRIERVLQHLPDPRRAVSELVRAARSGARIAIAEPDYGTLRIGGADQAVTRKILRQRRDHFHSGTIGRRLPGLCGDFGLTDLSVQLLTVTSTGVAHEDERRVLGKYAAAAQAAGDISEAEGATWLAQLAAAGSEGRYRHAITVFLVGGRKP